MPRLPLIQTPAVRHVPLNGANANAPEFDMPRLAIGERAAGVIALAKNIADFKRAKQQADDDDNISQALFEEQKVQGELDSRMRENPGLYAQFDTWRKDAELQSDEAGTPYLDKLSPDGLKRYNRVRLQSRTAFAKRVHDIAVQADISTQKNNYDNRIKFAVETGRFDYARQQAQLAVQNGIYSPDQLEGYHRYIDSETDAAAVRNLIDSGSIDVTARLEARGENGAFKEFPNLALDRRRALVSIANQKFNNDAVKGDDQLFYRLEHGEHVLESEVEDQLKNNLIDHATANKRLSMIRSFANRKAKAQTDLGKLSAKRQADSLEVQMMDFQFAPDPGRRAAERRNFHDQIFKEFKDHPDLVKGLLGRLNTEFNAADNPDDQSYKKSPVYTYAMSACDAVKDKLVSKSRGVWKGSGMDKEPNIEQNLALLKLAADRFIKEFPNSSQADLDKFLEQRVNLINQTDISERINAIFGNQPQPNGKIEVRRGKLNGRVVIQYSDGSVEQLTTTDRNGPQRTERTEAEETLYRPTGGIPNLYSNGI